MNNKLFKVEVSFVYYAVARSEREAKAQLSDALYNEPGIAMTCNVSTVSDDDALEDGWDGGCIPYGITESKPMSYWLSQLKQKDVNEQL
jgi:hypothetical protein